MKTLHLSIIAIVGIIVIMMTSVGVFMEKIDDNPQESYAQITINGVKENYTLNEPITFSVVIEGHGSGCGNTKVTITKENDTQYKSPEWQSVVQCTSVATQDNFKFTALSENTSINQTGNYVLNTLFDNLITHHKTTVGTRFSVMSSQIAVQNKTAYTSTFDNDKIHLMYANGTYSIFPINYNITGNNKVLSSTLDNKSNSIILSTRTTEDGNLTVILTPDLVNLVDKGKPGYQFIVLADGQEVKYKEQWYNQNMIMTIPFHSGTKEIEIFTPEIV